MSDLSEFVVRETARSDAQTRYFVASQVKRLKMSFPGKRWDGDDSDDLISYLVQELTAIANEFGQERTESAVTRSIREGTQDGNGRRNLSYMPTMAELRALVPPKRAIVRPDCKLCDNTGWVMTGERRAVRCACRRM